MKRRDQQELTTSVYDPYLILKWLEKQIRLSVA